MIPFNRNATLLAFGKRASNDDKKAVEDLLESVLKAQGH